MVFALRPRLQFHWDTGRRGQRLECTTGKCCALILRTEIARHMVRQYESRGKQLAIKKSELYSSLWASCDELRGGMDASQYKDYVLVLLFIKYVSDKYAGHALRADHHPRGRQLQGHGRAQGQDRHRRPDQQEDHRAAGQRQQAVRHAGLQRRRPSSAAARRWWTGSPT